MYYNTPLHLHKGVRYLGYKKGDFPVAERLSKKVLAFPHHQHLTKKKKLYLFQRKLTIFIIKYEDKI